MDFTSANVIFDDLFKNTKNNGKLYRCKMTNYPKNSVALLRTKQKFDQRDDDLIFININTNLK